MAGLVYRAKDTIVKALEYHLLSVPRAGEYVMTLSDGTKVWLMPKARSNIRLFSDGQTGSIYYRRSFFRGGKGFAPAFYRAYS